MSSRPQGGPPRSSSPDKKGESKDAKKPDDKKGESADPPPPKVIRRETTLDENADPTEFDTTVGEDGKVSFEFRNQPWVDLVQWLSDISKLPLDWLELPGDRVNLRSPGRYTVEQTRDLFNRYLLARGYTLLEIDGGLTIAKTETINPAIVPRVAPESLGSLPSHSFVRTSLDVGWLSAEKLSEELAPMISSNGKLTALTTTNRIEAMDAAINLRQVANLLEQERNNLSREALAPEFVLRYLPAEEAKTMLEQFLGVEKKESKPMTPQQMQAMQRMQQQQGGKAPAKKEVEVSIVANVRQNSVLIRAPVDRVAIATEFLKRIDVQGNNIKNLMDVQSSVQVFRLASLDPGKLIEIVSEMNVLEPSTRVRVDKENKALIVSGSVADRYIINSLIERLDGSGRRFEVLPLRRLDPVEVAESIQFLMGKKEEENKSSGRRSYYYSYYDRQEEESKNEDEFRVAANTRLRQVLLWANDQEMNQVETLLVKLGELPPPGGSKQTVRMLDASATPETLEYLQRLQIQWKQLSPNPLKLPDASLFDDPNDRPDQQSTGQDSTGQENTEDEMAEDGSEPTSSAAEDPLAKSGTAGEMLVGQVDADKLGQETGTVQVQESEAPVPSDPVLSDPVRSAAEFERRFQSPDASRSNLSGSADSVTQSSSTNQSRSGVQPPPTIRVELDSQGNLVLISPDTEALDRLENLMLQIKPPKRPYRVFHIEHASSYWMRLNLEDYFKDLDDEEESEADRFFGFYWGTDNDKEKKSPTGLGKGNKLKFVDDLDTNTLVVTGATSEQLRTIIELIELWDVPEPVNKRKTRFTQLVSVQFGDADKIAETVKEAYRDLLSSNDKTFAKGGKGGGNQGQSGPNVDKSREGSGTGLENTESGRNGGGADFSFKGKLSIGIDEVGNTLLISAEGEPLLELVTEMVRQLDEAARPQGEVQIVELSGDMNGDSLKAALGVLGTSQSTSPRKPDRPRSQSAKPGQPAFQAGSE